MRIVAEKGLEALKEEIIKCRKCPLHATRNKAVPGWGNHRSDMVFIGEAPGREEDLEGIPFVGRGGKLLDEALKEAGTEREKVYITNLVKCRPPKNRRPRREEVFSCSDYLQREMLIVRPKVIVLLGSTAATYLYNESLPYRRIPKIKKVEENRGKPGTTVIRGEAFPSFVTYHPAAALRKPGLKQEIILDIKKVLSFLRSSSEKGGVG